MTMSDQLSLFPPRPIENLLDDLDFWTGRTKRALVHEAIERYGAIAPRLLAHLEQVLADPDGYLEEDHDLLPYALVLLAHFRDERAHPLILAIFGLPDEIPYNLVGDMQTTAVPFLLLRSCGGSFDGIRTLVLNRRANAFVRWAAMEGLCLAVIAGMADRRETIDFLAGLLTGEEAEPGSHFWSGVANCLLDLYPDEVKDVIDKAYGDGLIIPGVVSPKDFEESMALGLDAAFERLHRELDWRVPKDIDKALGWCESIADTPAPAAGGEPRPGKNKAKQKKKRRKIVKASKRRNR